MTILSFRSRSHQHSAAFTADGIAGYFRLMPASHQYQRVRELFAAGMSVDAICLLVGWGPHAVRETLESRS
jgi:hypothetical protein